MDLIILELAEEAEVSDLKSLFKGLADKAEFKIVIQSYVDGSHCRYGIANFKLPKLGRKSIRKFNNKKLLDAPVTVRQFHHRTYQNERRALDWRNKVWDKPERRIAERRRKVVNNIEDELDIITNNFTVEEVGDEVPSLAT